MRKNIPAILTSFVGRKRELAEVKELLASARLVTLTGTAGSGKTRLALQVAAEVSGSYRDGVCWVDLARLNDPAVLAQEVARATGLVAQAGRPVPDQLLDALQDANVLLILDNCEHLQSACRELAEKLVQAPSLSVMATSREPLNVTGERRYPLLPMALPPAGVSMQDLAQFDALQLFVARAQAILPEFRLTPDNVGVVARICRDLDGIPLAIELASARVNVLALEQLVAGLSDRFVLLAPAIQVTHTHHRTLGAALDWSYDLLTVPEQTMLLRLSAFAGGCTLAAADAVCAGSGLERRQVLELLSSLVDKSLVVAQTLTTDQARYRLLETIRLYAQEKLVAANQRPEVCGRHLKYYCQLAEEALPQLIGEQQQTWLDLLEQEWDNMRAALAWSAESDQVEAGLRIGVAIYQFWVIRDYVEEGLSWMERLLAKADERVSSVVRANALAYAAFLAGFRGHTAKQIAYGRAAAGVAEAAGEEGKRALAWALAAQAYGARAEGDYQTELALGERVVQLNRELGDRYQVGVTLSVYSFPAMALGKYAAARAMLEESLDLLRQTGNVYRIAMALNYLGDTARCEGDYVAGQRAYEESLALLSQIDAPRDRASVLQNLGHTYLHLDAVERGRALFSESLATQMAQQNTPGAAECLIGFAAVAVATGMPAAAARLLAAAEEIGGRRIVSTWVATRFEYEHCLALVRSQLSGTDFQAEWTTGGVFTLQQAVQEALHLQVAASTSDRSGDQRDDLTLRERQIATLIAQGKLNGEIADQLVVSKRTVEKHIANILSKLGFTNRAQIVRWVLEVGPVSLNGRSGRRP